MIRRSGGSRPIDGLQGRDTRQFGQALRPGEGDELSDVGGLGAGVAGGGIEFAA